MATQQHVTSRKGGIRRTAMERRLTVDKCKSHSCCPRFFNRAALHCCNCLSCMVLEPPQGYLDSSALLSAHQLECLAHAQTLSNSCHQPVQACISPCVQPIPRTPKACPRSRIYVINSLLRRLRDIVQMLRDLQHSPDMLVPKLLLPAAC